MRYSEFRQLVDEVLGPQVGRALVRDLVLDSLGDRTAAQAVEDGEDLRTVWRALCDAMDVPASRRWGDDRRPADRRRV